jgi:hypothetical protein
LPGRLHTPSRYAQVGHTVKYGHNNFITLAPRVNFIKLLLRLANKKVTVVEIVTAVSSMSSTRELYTHFSFYTRKFCKELTPRPMISKSLEES